METNSPFSPALKALLDAFADALAQDDLNRARQLAVDIRETWQREQSGENARLELEAVLRPLEDLQRLNAEGETAGGFSIPEDPRYLTQWHLYAHAATLDDPFATTRSGEEVDRELVFPVWFGTNRKPNDPTDFAKGFCNLRAGRVHYGRADVSIPGARRFGETGNPWWKRWWRLEFRDDYLRVQSGLSLTDEEFRREIRAAIEIAAEERGTAQALVFLHGFNTGFEDAAIRAAQLGHDLNVPGPTAFFSWPSRGTLRGYPSDAATIEASENEITAFLTRFVSDCGATKVHLIAHSMGNRGLLRALQRIAADAETGIGIRFGQIFLAAPDVDRDLFLSLARLYPAFSERTTLYASQRDKALWTSKWLHEAPRAGFFPPVTVSSYMDTIEVPGFNSDRLGHNSFATAGALLYDISGLMSQNVAPSLRQRLSTQASDAGTYWRFLL